MINAFKTFGFNGAEQFLATKFDNYDIFYKLIKSNNWQLQKYVLKHAQCPIDIRSSFSNSAKGYIRKVAMLSQAAGSFFKDKAINDLDLSVRVAALNKNWDIANNLLGTINNLNKAKERNNLNRVKRYQNLLEFTYKLNQNERLMRILYGQENNNN